MTAHVAEPSAGSAAEQLSRLRIVDCDSHLTEPADLWSSRAPKSMIDRMPEQRTTDGRTAWYQDGEPWASTGGNTLRHGREKVLGQLHIQPFQDIDPSAWRVKDRLELLDALGIYAQILYPNGIGFSSNHIFAIKDDGVRTAVLQIYNDFLSEVQEESGGRLFPQAMLPIWDMELTVQEMSRLLDRGITGFTLSDRPELLGLPELLDPYFAPMWDLLNGSGAVANFHIGAGARREETEARRAAHSGAKKASSQPGERKRATPTVAEPYLQALGPQRRLAVLATQAFMSNVRIIANLCASNLFDSYPDLRIVSAESGIGWVPFALEAMEFQFDEVVSDRDEVRYAQRRPTEYFRDHISVMFWFEETAPQLLIEKVGVNNVLVETDIPHPACLFPSPHERFAKVLADVDPYIRQRVLQDNAAELYSIEVPK